MKSLILVKVLLYVTLFIKTDVLSFECDNGTIIPDSKYCDDFHDCNDKTDEGYGCTRLYCRKGKFTCRTGGACLDIKVRCDGIVGCEDQSDDQECGALGPREVPSENCTLIQGKFHCKNKLACLNYSSVCDGRCDCLDCSDEDKLKCASDSESCSFCTDHYCLPTLDGPQCVCDLELEDEDYSSLCKNFSKCNESSGCSHYCFTFQSRQYCSCDVGYHLTPISGGRRCRSDDWFSSAVIYSTATKVKSYNLTTNQTLTLATGVQCTALAAARYYIYYATPDSSQKGSKNYIFKTRINSNSKEQQKLVESNSRITSIAVDYITNNIYYTANESLISCTNSGQNCIQLKCCGVSRVVLAPMSGWMFYIKKGPSSDQKEAKYYIMRSNMDGSAETYFADNTFDTSNFSFVVDEPAKKVLFIIKVRSSYGILNSRLTFMSFDAESQQTRFGYHWETISSLSVLDHQVFYSVKDDEKVYYAENYTIDYASFDPSIYFRDNSSRILTNLLAHDPLLPRSTENPCDEVSCQGLCLLRPISSVNPGLTYTCRMENASSLSAPSTADQTRKSNESSQSENSFGTISVLLVVVAVLGCGGYLAFQKRNLYQHLEKIRAWKRDKFNARMEIVEEFE